MSRLLHRVGAFFLEPGATPAPVAAARQPEPAPAPGVAPLTAAVLGAPAVVVPVAAACAGELRARRRAGAALICVWRPPGAPAPVVDPDAPEPPARSPAGATTPGARRLAGRLAAHGLAATACGRLAWLPLEPDAGSAAAQVGRALGMLDVPLVLAVAGPRPAAFEPLLATLDLAVAVLPPDADPSLRELAAAALPTGATAVVAPLPPGPPRWAAMAGLARLRSLPEVER